jgi:hypothetical protein
MLAQTRERLTRSDIALRLRGGAEGELLERILGEAAYQAEWLIGQGSAVSLALGDDPLLESGYGPGHLRRLLDVLALLPPQLPRRDRRQPEAA